jgi:hypothetical protein
MPLRIPAVAVLTAALSLQPACATSSMPSKCSATGYLKALSGMDGPAICKQFERDLAAALGPAGMPEGVAIALTLHQRGAIEAQFATRDGDESPRYPKVSVDAIDRALQPGDITRLASAAAQMLTDQTRSQAGQPAADQKRD